MNDFMNPRKVAAGIWLIPTPQPLYPSTNSYLIEGTPLTLIDSGHPIGVFNGVLQKNLRSIGYEPDDIEQIIYTHSHMDHNGGGFVLSHYFQCEHLAYHTLADEFKDPDRLYDTLRFLGDGIVKYYPSLDGIANTEEQRKYHREATPYIGHLNGHIQKLHDGQILNIGARQLKVIWTPGHCPHHICLLDSQNGLLFSGDFILKFPTGLAFIEGDSVETYLQSLNKMKDYGSSVRLVLPAHDKVLDSGLDKIIAKKISSIDQRGQKILQYLAVSGEKSIIEIFDSLYPKLRWNDINWLGVLSTLITHLRYLKETSQINELKDTPGTFSMG